MKKLVVALVTIVALVWAPVAQSEVALTVKVDTNSLLKFGEKAGCKNLHMYDRPSGLPNGVFVVINNVPWIRLMSPEGMPPVFRAVIFYHELGHCMQYEEGAVFPTLPDAEQDADTRGANFACQQGMDGIQMAEDWFTYLHDNYGYNGDEGHGTIEQRKASASRAEVCKEKRHFS